MKLICQKDNSILKLFKEKRYFKNSKPVEIITDELKTGFPQYLISSLFHSYHFKGVNFGYMIFPFAEVYEKKL